MGAGGYAGYTYGSILSIALTDSTYLWLLVNLGFIGLILFFLIIYHVIKIFTKIYSEQIEKANKIIILTLFINSVSFFVYGIIGTNIEMKTSIIYFCFYIVLLIKSERFNLDENIALPYMA